MKLAVFLKLYGSVSDVEDLDPGISAEIVTDQGRKFIQSLREFIVAVRVDQFDDHEGILRIFRQHRSDAFTPVPAAADRTLVILVADFARKR